MEQRHRPFGRLVKVHGYSAYKRLRSNFARDFRCHTLYPEAWIRDLGIYYMKIKL